MQVTNGNKRFTKFPTMTNMKNILLITEIKFLRSLMDSCALQIKFGENIPTFHDKVHENAINQNEKPQRAEK